jgi:GMP synthase (glutamine-hydrolysing)
MVESTDAVTAKAKEVPYATLKKISEGNTTESSSACRCLYDITDKPPSTIEFE